MDSKLKALIEEAVTDLGFDLVSASLNGQGDKKILEVLVERKDCDRIKLEDCKIISQNISAMLDVEDVIKGKYFLEVSSAGLDRPLVGLKDYVKYLNRQVSIKLKAPIEGQGRYKGTLLEAREDEVVLLVVQDRVSVPFNAIKTARLIFTEDMFRELLKKQKQASQGE